MIIKRIEKKVQIDSRMKLRPRERVAAYCRVSTDSEEQLKSYNSMVDYYTEYISKNPEWDFAGVYSDEAVTGTKVDKREGFKKLIQDCFDGKIDRIVTKSISRFARNTVDTLTYVRLLRDRGIGITFETPPIDTLKDGEFLLSILSSVAQQEVENISASVKKGLQFKMVRGELVGGSRCLGYDYDRESKTFVVIKDEAEIVRDIFDMYVNGMGCDLIAKELNSRGLKTIRGNDWSGSTILGIVKNEKYVGDILYGKTFTVDPISKRRLENHGEQEQTAIIDHHEPIISREIFDSAQKIVKKRGFNRKIDGDQVRRIKYSRKYSFSSMLECGFCGTLLSRRSWHAGSIYQKNIWMCIASTKKGKIFCPNSKGVSESDIEDAFLQAYHKITCDNSKAVKRFTKRLECTLGIDNVKEKIAKAERKAKENMSRRQSLLEKYLEGKIEEDVYRDAEERLTAERDRLTREIDKLKTKCIAGIEVEQRLREFKKAINENKSFEEFDRTLFESIVEKVIVGGYDEEDKPDPYRITFIFKNGFGQEINVKKASNNLVNNKKGDNSSSEVCSQGTVDVCSNTDDSACRDMRPAVKKRVK